MPESTHQVEGVVSRLAPPAPQPTSLEERKSPLAPTITMQVKLPSTNMKFYLIIGQSYIIYFRKSYDYQL